MILTAYRDLRLTGSHGQTIGPRDMQNACIDFAESIDITGDGTGFNCGVDTIVNLRDSEVRNDFGKTGFITITGCGGTGIIDISNALIVDEGKNGGGPDPNRVANMNGGTATVNVNCAAASVPTCNTRPVSATRNPVSADPAGRASHAVVGVPRCDTWSSKRRGFLEGAGRATGPLLSVRPAWVSASGWKSRREEVTPT